MRVVKRKEKGAFLSRTKAGVPCASGLCMTLSFNLVNECWVPCVRPDGRIEERSLRDALAEAHLYRELGDSSPLVAVAIYRLMLAVLHRVYGPGEEPERWVDLWRRGHWDAAALDAYLLSWSARFDLFDAVWPFYQSPYPGAKQKSVISLVSEWASGNNAVLFDHHREEEGVSLSPAEAARAVLAAQACGLAALSGFPDKFTDGPSARGITFLLHGDNLFEILMLNLLPYPADDIFPMGSEVDRPAWELDDPFAPARGMPHGYLDYLTWQNRRIMLSPEEGENGASVRQMTWGPGLRLDAGILDPLKHYRRDVSRGWLVLRFNADRALWRDSAVLLRQPVGGQDTKIRSPRALDWLPRVMDLDPPGLTRRHMKRLLALGMANDRAKVEFFRREQLPLPLEFLNNRDLATHLDAALAEAEAVGGQLWGALATLAMQLLFHKEEQHLSKPERGERDHLIESWSAEWRYWAGLEPLFAALVDGLTRDAGLARRAWAEALRQEAWKALERVCESLGNDPASLKAEVLARGQLGGGINKELGLWFPRSVVTEGK
jgi:CRISPR system Cascade subunit CasA